MTERESAPNQPPDMEPAIRAIAMPADANGNGDIFGGWIMSQMDLAGGNVASVAARGRLATVGVKEIAFLVPVGIGDEVTCYAEVTRLGNTSMQHVDYDECRGLGAPAKCLCLRQGDGRRIHICRHRRRGQTATDTERGVGQMRTQKSVVLALFCAVLAWTATTDALADRPKVVNARIILLN